MCLSFAEIGDTNLIPMDYVSGGTSFFVVGIGGVIVGVIFSLIVGFVTKYVSTSKIKLILLFIEINFLI